jgi:Flp pilus assembly protein TadG
MVKTVAGIAGRDQAERAPRGLTRGRGGLRRVGAVRRLLRCTSGISSVEFAIILPVLMMFLFSIIAFGTALYANVNMENAAREAVRRMAVAEVLGGTAWSTCGVDAQATSAGTAEFLACTYLADWAPFEVTTLSAVCPDTEVTVSVRVPGESVALGDVFGFFNGRTLTAEVVMRREAACT